MSVDADVESRERNEKLSLRIVGACFVALAGYIAYESVSDLIRKTSHEHSIPGIVLACVSLIVMPMLSRAKKKVGKALGSAAMKADARQTDFCVYLSTILLAGLFFILSRCCRRIMAKSRSIGSGFAEPSVLVSSTLPATHERDE
jgi:divalent metal cation (Fe/Co/Zn/Cd) transporter